MAKIESARKDLTGHEYSYFKVIERGNDKRRNARNYTTWVCKCVCGAVLEVETESLRSGNKQSCGCMRGEKIKSHGMTDTKEYRAWRSIIARCKNSSVDSYPMYGGRGVLVCDRWLESFDNFYADMGDSPSQDHSIDRIDFNGNYEPSNCRWATATEQANNKSNSRYIEHNGERLTITQWAKKLGIRRLTISSRLDRGLSVEKALSVKRLGQSKYGAGISKSEESGRYLATICSNRKHIHLGSFASLAEAKDARRKAEIKFFGKMSSQKLKRD